MTFLLDMNGLRSSMLNARGLRSHAASVLFRTAETVGFQSLGLGVVHRFLWALQAGMEPWNPGTLEPAVGLQSRVKLYDIATKYTWDSATT